MYGTFLPRAAGTPLRLRNWRRVVWIPAVEAAGLSDITPHDLRHTPASQAVASGAHAKSVQIALLRHAQLPHRGSVRDQPK
jgi:site-specific recombinase XerD